jgi:hypothetical protein
MLNVAIANLAFALALASDYLETRYVRAVRAWEDAEKPTDAQRARHIAAHSSIGMWIVGVIGLVACVEVGWWVLIPEGAGLYAGTLLSMRR